MTNFIRATPRVFHVLRRSARPAMTSCAESDCKTVVMVHGMHSTPQTWDCWRKKFEDASFTVITPMLRFHDVAADGPSPAALGRVSVQDYVQDLAEEMRALPCAPMLIGHSMGAVLVLKLLEMGIGRGAVLLAPAGPSPLFAPWPSQLVTFLPNLLGWPLQRPVLLRRWHADFGFFNMVPPEERQAQHEQLVWESGRAALEHMWWPLSALLTCARTTSYVDPAKVTQPLVVFGGDMDRATPPRTHRAVAKRFGAEYEQFRPHGHWLPSEPGWEVVADTAITWLRATFPSGDDN